MAVPGHPAAEPPAPRPPRPPRLPPPPPPPLLLLLLLLLPCLLLLAPAAHANPLRDPNVCGRPTCVGGPKFAYAPHTRYDYSYSLNTSALFQGTSRNESTLRVTARVSLLFLSSCEGELKVSDVALWEGWVANGRRREIRGTQRFEADVSEFPLRFSFHDGIISELCPAANETSWVLNLKRGILSTFQNSMRRFDVSHKAVEADVHGECETHYSLDRVSGTSLILNKTKDFSTCISRNKFHSILQTTPYVFHSAQHGVPVVRSRGSCDLWVDHNVYSRIDCSEAHIFQPFSNGSSGATTRVRQALELLQEEAEPADTSEPVDRRVPLLFDHDLTPKPTSGELRASRDLLRTMCVLHDGDVQPQFPHAFAHFLRTARLLSSSALTQLYLRAPALCRTARQHLLSALPLLGSNAAVALMRDLILRGGVDRSLAHDWLFAVAFIPRPDLRTVALLSPLLRNRSADAQQVLAVSSVVRSYCRWNPSCADQRPVYEIMEHLLRVLRDAMSARVWTRQPLEKAVVAVKALANVGLASDSLRTTLRRCLADPGVPLELRLACIDAHRRLPCEDTRPFFLELFRNQTADPELRIAAYLQVMRCPNYNVIKTIKHTLEVEEVNQVGSFVWTHLNNLLKSSIPSRVELQGLLQQRDLEKKFSSDARKFSHNFQGSVFFDEYNAGGNYDSNVIFSPKSYIPRSGMLNLTVDLFGESINVFEVSGRLEGFEHYLESIFGPRGPLSSRKVNDKLEDALKRVRLARDVNNNLVDQVDSIPNVIDNNFNHPKASLGLKVFGNELRYHTLDGEDEVADALNKVNPVRLLQQLLSGQEINYNKATMFMDADYVVPTGGGLPLSLNAFGTAAVSLKMSGSLKGSNFLQTGELDVTGNIRPSVAVNVVGTMGVDAYYSSAGIRLKTNLYTSSAVDAQLKVRGKRLVSLAFNLPKDKMEIVTAESELLVLAGAGAVELPQRGDARGRVERRFCSWPALDQTLGLNFCADLQFPNASHRADAPGFLLNGPTRFSLAFQKADLTANKYLLEYKWETTQTNSSVVSLVFDTPGSAQKRELSARLHLDNNTNNLTLLIQSAKVKYEALGRYKNTEGDKHILFELNINDKKHVDMELSLKTEKITNGFKYLPRLYLEINSTGIAELSGTLQLIEKKGVSQCDVNLEFKTRKLESQLTGYVKRGEATVQLYLKLNYKFQNATDETVTLDASFTHRHSKSYTRAEGEIKIISSAYPKYNFKSSLHYQSSNGHFECLFEINYGLNIDDIRNKFTLSMEFTFAKSYDTTKINLAVRVTKPITDINLQFTVSYLSSGPETNVRSIIRYATGKDIHITLDLKIPRSALTFIEAKLNVTLPTFHPMVLDLQLHEKTPNEYNIDVTATWFSGHTVTAKGLYQDKSTHKASSHNVKLLLKSPSFEEIAASYKYLRDETELKVELTADHAKDKYYIILKHANPQPSDYETSIELRIKSQVYSLLTVVSLLEHRQITAQLHIDRIRDIHFMLRSLNQPDRKEASMEVKWDANRDPSQKVAVAVQYLHPESMNYSGYVMVSYPGRTIRGNYLFALKDSRCESSAHLEWSPRDSIQITVGAIYEYEDILMLALKSELLTPFESWKRTSLSAGIRHHDNLVQANASVYWHDDQNVALNLYGDYMLSDEEFSCELNASIISTIPQVSSMSGSFSHKQSNNKYDTLLYIQHYPQKAISIKSTWQLEEDENSSNLTGVVNLQSPYPGYNEGMMRCRMHVNSAWDVKGAADLIIDRRKYTFQINGYVKKLTDNMLVFEITTPMENYSKITGRFGYSGERKHLVAEISSPHAQIGIEILFQFQNTNNFDIKFNVATPIEFLQKAILVAKLEEETVDFRCGWNNLTIGFFGQWHYENITDFEYCYKIFTPLEGFHENGVIAKLIKHEGLDFSLGFNVGDKKLGLKVYGASNPAPPPDLKLATKQLYDDEAYDDEDEELINWKGSIEVDTFFHPTLKGTLEIEEKDTTYIVASTLTLPNGTAVLLDELDFEDVFTISNKFHLKTPYPQFEEIHSTYDYKIDLGVQFKTAVYVAVLHNKQWKEAGASVNYTYDGEDDSALQTWTASVNIFSPFDLLKFYLVQGVLEVEGTVYRTNVTMSTSDSRLTSTGFLQADEDYFESALSFGMVSPVYTIPSLRISGKRDFTQPEKRIELMLESLHPLAEMYKFQGHWNLQSRQNFGLGMTLNTPYESMPSATFGVAYRMANDNSSTQLNIILSPLPQHTWKLDSIVIGDQISTDLETPIENYSKLALNGTLTSDKENSYTIKGTLKCENRIYTVDGSTSANAESPLQAELTLADQNDGSVILIHANIKPVENGFNLSCGMQNGKENFDLQGHLRMKNLLDFNYFVKATSTHATYSLIYFDGTVFQISDGNITAIFNADTSLPGYRKIRFFSNISLKEQAGALKTSLETETVNTRFNLEWALKLFENILLAFDGHYQDPEITKSGTVKVFFAFPRGKGKNPRKDVSLGAYVNLDKDAWLFGSNATLSFSTSIEDIDVQAHVILPPPRYDIHSFQGQMHFNEKFDDLKFLAKYKTAITKKNYGLSSRYLVKNDNINGNVQMEFGPGQLDYINNVFNVRRDNTTVEGTYVLTTPLYEENTLRATALYKVLPEFNIVRAQLFYPESQNVSKVMVDFRDFGNMNGTLISNTPLENLPYAGVHFRASTKNIHHERFAEVFWPNNTALFDSKYVYQRTTSTFTTELKGSLLVEIPLATRHTGKINYNYMEKSLNKTGHASIEYNDNQLLEGNYKCVSESSAGREKDKIEIDLENEYFPLGIFYTHENRYSGGNEGTNLPTIDIKHAEVFKLNNMTAFHLTGELKIKTTHSGQDILMTAKHLKRVVTLQTDYDQKDNEFTHRSMLTLDPDSWASYDITIVNKTTDEKDEEHIDLNFAYPQRNFTVSGYYQLANNSLSSEMKFVWDKETRSVGTSLDWKRLSYKPNKQHAVFSIKHPSFIRDITLNGIYYSDDKDLINVSTDLVYSNDARKKLSLSGKIQDISQGRNKKYQYQILGSHPATRLDLNAYGGIILERGFYKTNNKASYGRSYLSTQTGELNGMVNTHEKEIDFEKKTPGSSTHLKGKFTGKYPVYRVNGTTSRGRLLNSTGDFYVHFEDKIFLVSVNTTQDGSDRYYYMDGNIPDSRNALFNVWTDYEDIRVNDVVFYLRLNHSRLVTSKLRWRPELETEIRDYVDTFGKEVWNGFFANAEYWKNYIRSEINDSVQDIWKDAQPIIQGFLDDVEELNSLKDDFEKFKIYLNDSYNNNDFYVQDIVGFCNKLVDDLAIRAHIESLPAFVKEIWDIMGESGEAILKSLRWIIDTIKNSFQKAVDFINSLMRGDLTSKISDLMTKLVEKYDKFIKDLHVAFVKYMSDLWHKTSALLTEHWNNFVLTVEPTFVMIAHYVETIVWNVSTEVLDFLYQRKTELVESPYFSKFANFTQDLDKFYKDIMKNDIITNIRKYSKIVYEFIRDKYFAMVPFGKELEDIANEIISELKVLQKLPSINYAIEKSNELYEKIVWVYNYLDLGTRIQKAITLVHLKITDITQTALQAENRYREAKTLFIFDPDNGLVILEQKLPMSWHAFNETPRFEEIPEYKAINDLQNYFVSSNITFWTLYYEYKPYTEPSNWLPPFSGQAIIAGPQHFMTFDRSFYEFQGSCSYLLASDFVDRNFSLAISYDVKKGEHVISVIIGKEIIHIDIFNDEVTIEKGENKMLPIEIGDTFIYQEASIVTVESEKGFKIQCNMKFDVCVISLSGWYFGKTAGLLGTMDNEPTSDFLTPQKILEKDIGKFAQSWALNRETCSSTKNFAVMKPTPEDALVTKCNEFFKMKSSQFSSCFSRVDSTPFLNMCLNSRDSADKDPCTVAVAYMQACTIENTPLRIPESCVKCRILVPDMEVPEGDFRQLEGNEVPKSTDVVFIVEAGSCNSNITTERSLDALLTSLSKELTGAGFTSNRYSVVVFGGDGVYNQPRSVVLNNNVFTTPEEILQYFENIPTGSGDKDIFGAIRFAAQLVFRPGVSKTFILIPCSNCNPGNMTLDYSVLHQVLLERGIQLHILMNDEFRFQKQKAQKNFYGMDRDNAYTNKDIKDLKGDSDLKRQVLLPKSKLGVCTALALETNGTVFTAKRLQGDKKNVVKKFVTVFAKRVAQTADPYPCQKCECTADNNGISYMECFPCEYPQPSQYNYNFDEDLDISAISAIADEEEADYLDEDI